MASISLFVSQFRGSITEMLDAHERADALVAFATQQGWGRDTWATLLGAGSDISADDFAAAVAAIAEINAVFEAHEVTLGKLKP